MPDSEINIYLIDNYKEIISLEPEWNQLLLDSKADCIFLGWEWISTWVDIHKSSVDPYILIARDSTGRLAGIAPLYRSRFGLSGGIKYRVLRVLGDFASGSDYLDWIIAHDVEQEVSEAFIQFLLKRKDWDLLWIPKMSGTTDAHQNFERLAKDHGCFIQSRLMKFSSIGLPDDFNGYMQSLSKSRKKEISYKRRRLLKQPGVTVVRCNGEGELEYYLDNLFKLHALRWRKRGEQGAFIRKPDEKKFYEIFAPIALKRGWLKIFALVDNGEFKAVQIGYVYNNVFHSIQEGFDPDYFSGVGNVLRSEVIRWCIESNIHKYDFLGDHSVHKKSWGAASNYGHEMLLGKRILKNIPVQLATIWPKGRYLKSYDIPV